MKGLCKSYIRDCMLVLIRNLRIYERARVQSLLADRWLDDQNFIDRLWDLYKRMDNTPPRATGYRKVWFEAKEYVGSRSERRWDTGNDNYSM
jgi:hypothetical protein